MATRALSADAGRASSGILAFPSAPPVAITRVLSRFDRDQLEGFIAVAIDLLDFADGDAEAETTGLEDDFVDHPADGPGCPVSDVDRCPAYDDDQARLLGDGKPGDPVDREDGHDREAVNEDGTDETLPAKPVYGEDQSRGPINGHAAYRAWQGSLQ